MTGVRAKLSPAGFVAQRFDHGLDTVAWWVETFLDDNGVINVRVLQDDEVADWPDLHLHDDT